MSTINDPIVLDKKKVDLFKMMFYFLLCLILNSAIAIYNLSFRDIPTKEIYTEIIVYEESFVPTKIDLSRSEFNIKVFQIIIVM